MSQDLRPRPDSPGESIRAKIVPLTLVTLILLLLPLVGASCYALVAFERKLLPEIEKKALRAGLSITAEIRRAVDFGIPFGKLAAMDRFFAAKLETARDIAYVAVTAGDGAVLYQQGALDANQHANLAADAAEVIAAGTTVGKVIPRYRLPATLETLLGDRRDALPPARPGDGGGFYRIALPIETRDAIVGVLHLGIDARIVARQIEAILLDIAIVLLVTASMAFELLLLIAVTGIAEPLRQLDSLLQRLGRGDFSLTLAAAARDRLGRLGRSLDALIERVNARHRAVSRSQVAARAFGRTGTNPVALAGEPCAGAIFAAGQRPDSDRASNPMPVRAAAFLFVFAEELARPFLPIYARELATPIDGWSHEFLAALSISVFMSVMALATPAVSPWSSRIGHRNLFLLGALLSTVGLGGTGLAFGYGDLLGWRALSALGYALTFAACQGYLLDNTSPENRTHGMATFAGGIVTASICGPAIGGILAERIGYGPTFAVGAALAIGSALLVARLIPHYIPRRQGRGDAKGQSARGMRVAELLGNPRFLILAVFAAAPAKLLLAGFLFFLAPLLLAEQGASLAEIGRIAMSYGIAALACMPLFVRLAGRWNAPGFAVGAGCSIAGLGLIPVLFAPGPATVLLAVIGLGAGQAASMSAQAALLALVCKDAIAARGAAPVAGVCRVIEHLAAAAGPLVAVAFADAFGHAGAALALGVLGTVSAILFSAAFLILGATPEDDDVAHAAPNQETPA